MEELLAEQDRTSRLQARRRRRGNRRPIDKDEILVDISEVRGVVSNRELYRHAESQPQFAIGDTVPVYVLQPESQEGHAVPPAPAGLERKWRAMQEQSGGVIIRRWSSTTTRAPDRRLRHPLCRSARSSLPRRLQNDQPRDAAQEIAEKLDALVGRKLRLKILGSTAPTA
jgi:hypothetical protein